MNTLLISGAIVMAGIIFWCWDWVKKNPKKTAVIGIGTALAATQLVPTITLEERIIQDIEISQDAYFQKQGHYWQGLPTHTSVPDKEEALNNLSVKPHYQAEGWNDLVNLPDKLPFQIEVHQYKAPKGYGYQIFLRNEEGVKSIGYGVEAQSRTWEIKISTTTATTTK